MANQANNTARHTKSAHKRPREGVSLTMVIVLLIVALLVGGLIGFLLSRRSDPKVTQMAQDLQEAQDRITELENTLTMIGFPMDSEDSEAFFYDDGSPDDAWGEVPGDEGDGGEDVWTEDSLLSGMLSEDGDPVVVAEFDGGQLLSSEVIPEFNDQLTSLVFAGNSADDVSPSLLQSVMSYMVSEKIIAAKAEELGMTELSAEDLAEIDRQAAQLYEEQVEEYAAYLADNQPEAPEAEGGEEAEAEPRDLRAEAEAKLAEEAGVTRESIAAELKESWWSQKFYDYVVKDVAVSDEETRIYYDEQLADQKKAFAEYPESFEYAHLSGDAIVYRPEGYRAVRDILIPFEDSADAARAAQLMDRVESGRDDAETREQLDALYAPLEAKAQEAVEKLASGQSFDSLMAEYGCSADLNTDALRAEGFYIADSSFINSTEFVEGSLLLERPGDISTPLRSAYGVHLVQYIGDVPAGEVPLAEVKDVVSAEALELKRFEYYESQREAMLEQANVRYYPERLH